MLLYIHGYNTSFEQAVLRAAQISFDIKFAGITAVYSWPSKARVKGYGSDRTAAESSQNNFAEFVTMLALESGADRVNIIAHSMGNKVLIESLETLGRNLNTTQAKLGRVILAAPDVDVVRFRQLAGAYPQLSEAITMYVSKRDQALRASGWLADYQRAGHLPPVVVVPGIDTVDAGRVDSSLLGHGYFATMAPLLNDMVHFLNGKLPHERPQVFASADGTYWVMNP